MSIGQSEAEVAGVSSLKEDVSVLSPGGSPGVLDEPVSIVIPSDHQNSVVGGLSAVAEDSRGVGLPVGGIHTHSSGLGVNVVNQLVAALSAHHVFDLVGSFVDGAGGFSASGS